LGVTSLINNNQRSLRVIGHNAGTSMDGVDIVHVHFTQDSPTAPLNMQLLHYGEYPMPRKVKARVMKLIKENKTTPEEMAIVNIQLGEVVAAAVNDFARDQGFDVEKDVDLIAGQGQTIWHLPLPELFEGDQQRAHLDMAEIAIIAAETGVTSLGNFRVSDMALGRQGCPLFAALDSLLLNHPTLNRAVQNIGGIANFSVLPKGDVEGCYDFDTGPGNVFIDAAVRYFTNGELEYDKDGAMGAKGRVDQGIVDEILAGPYFVHDIPKTTGRETFGDTMAEDISKKMLAGKYRTTPDILFMLTLYHSRCNARRLCRNYYSNHCAIARGSLQEMGSQRRHE
jgi:1,6-anhydro-N-acetylmuramate kinase